MDLKMKRGSRNVVYEAPRGRRNAPYTTARGVTRGSENSAHDAVDVFKRFLTSWRTLNSQEDLSLTCLRHEQQVLRPFSTFPDLATQKTLEVARTSAVTAFRTQPVALVRLQYCDAWLNCDVCSNDAVFDDAFDGRCPHQFLLQSPQIWFEKHHV